MRFELKIAFRNLRRNPRQTFLNCLVVMLASGISIFLQSQQTGTQEQLLKTIVEPSVGYLQIQAIGYQESTNKTFSLNFGLKRNLSRFSAIELLIPRLENSALIQVNKKTKNALVVGIEPSLEKIYLSSKIIQGKYWAKTPQNAVLLAEGLAKSLQAKIGDSIRFLNTPGSQVFKIQGIIKLANPSQNKSYLYMPLAISQQIGQKGDSISRLILKIQSSKQSESLAQEIKTHLPPTLRLQTWQKSLPELAQLIQAEQIAENLVLGILYLLLSFIMLSSILMMTYERATEFATLISLGMKRWRLIQIILLEITMLGVLGFLLGFLSVLGVLFYLNAHPIGLSGDLAQSLQVIGLSPLLAYSLDWEVFFYPILSVLGIIFLTFAYPVYLIRKLEIVEKIK